MSARESQPGRGWHFYLRGVRTTEGWVAVACWDGTVVGVIDAGEFPHERWEDLPAVETIEEAWEEFQLRRLGAVLG